jgi:hypothetical protein
MIASCGGVVSVVSVVDGVEKQRGMQKRIDSSLCGVWASKTVGHFRIMCFCDSEMRSVEVEVIRGYSRL